MASPSPLRQAINLSPLLILAGLLTAALASVVAAVPSEFRPAPLFKDNAILQRDLPVPVWGKGRPDTEVTVEFAGQRKTTRVAPDGEWRVDLDPIAATAEPQTLRLQHGADPALEIRNIVVGEVWICAGQSNMQMRAKFAPDVERLRPDAENLRSFEVKNSVAFTEQADCDGQWVSAPPDSAVALAFAFFLEQSANVPIGIILTSWGSSSIEGWMPRDMTETAPHFRTIMEEFDADTATRDRIKAILSGPHPWPKPDDVFLRRQPNIIYNAMMAPLAPYACRGLVWYQGEANTDSLLGMIKEPWYARRVGMLKYGEILQQWIQRYRTEWNQPSMHFLIVLLPGYFKPLETGPQLGPEHPAAHSWAWMRESQLKALDLSHTSIVNTIDLGEEKNVHPKDKLPIGQRLALLARRDTLREPVVAEGPRMVRVDADDGRLVVHFDPASGLTTTDGGPPAGFWITDDSQNWVAAEAHLDGDSVILRSRKLPHPRYVRYAFAGKPQVNLVNKAGLPAYPFRTDSFNPAARLTDPTNP